MVFHMPTRTNPPGCEGVDRCFFEMMASSTTWRKSVLSIMKVQRLDREGEVLLKDR